MVEVKDVGYWIDGMVLTVRLLESGTSTLTTEFLWFWSSSIGDQQGSVVRGESLLQLVLGLFVNVLLVVSNQTLSNSLSDSVDLRDVTTTGDSNSDVDLGELVQTDQQQWFVNLESQDFWFNQSDWRTVDLNQTLTGLNVGNGSSRLLLTKSLFIN